MRDLISDVNYCIGVPQPKFWGTCPLSPVIYVHGA